MLCVSQRIVIGQHRTRAIVSVEVTHIIQRAWTVFTAISSQPTLCSLLERRRRRPAQSLTRVAGGTALKANILSYTSMRDTSIFQSLAADAVSLAASEFSLAASCMSLAACCINLAASSLASCGVFGVCEFGAAVCWLGVCEFWAAV